MSGPRSSAATGRLRKLLGGMFATWTLAVVLLMRRAPAMSSVDQPALTRAGPRPNEE